MKTSRSFLLVTTIAVVGLAAGSAFAQPMTLTPAMPAQPAQPVPPTPTAPTAVPAPPAGPMQVDPRMSYRPGDMPMRLMLGDMLGERLEAMDTDGDGKITAAEFQAAAEALFAQLDANGDGVLDDADRREPAVAAGGDARPVPERRDGERRAQEFRGGMMGPNGGMMVFPGGPMFYGMPGMWFFAVPMMPPQGGPDFRGGPNFQVPMLGPGAGPGGAWFYWDQPERRRD